MARGLNKALLIGNLGADPEMRYTASGMAVVNFRVATSRRRRDPNGNMLDETEWHRIVAYERLAEIASQYLHKGSQVFIEGRIQSRKYMDNQNIERTVYEIIANDLTLLGSRGDLGGGSGDDWGDSPNNVPQRPQRPQAQSQQPQRQQPAGQEETFGSEDLDDVPF